MPRASSTVEPLFLKEDDLPSADMAPLTIVRAIVRVTSSQAVDGVQRIGRLWRVYMKSVQHRLSLPTQKSVLILGKNIFIYEQNHFRTNQVSPEDQKDKLTIRGLPLSVSINEEVKSMLEDKGVVLSSSIMYACMRDEDGTLTRYRNGDIFIVTHLSSPFLNSREYVGSIAQCSIMEGTIATYASRALWWDINPEIQLALHSQKRAPYSPSVDISMSFPTTT